MWISSSDKRLHEEIFTPLHEFSPILKMPNHQYICSNLIQREKISVREWKNTHLLFSLELSLIFRSSEFSGKSEETIIAVAAL